MMTSLLSRKVKQRGALPPSVNPDVLDQYKGTSNVVARLEKEKKIVFGTDSRLTLDDMIRSDWQQKYELITPNVVATMVGSGGGCQKVWKRMQDYCRSEEEQPKTIYSISKYGSDTPREDEDKLSLECFVFGIENDKPTICHVIDVYDELTQQREKGAVKVDAVFAALGCENRTALESWDKETEGRSLDLDLAITAVLSGLLNAALNSFDVGGTLRVIQWGSTGIEKEINKTVIDLYLQFYERFRELEDRSFFIFYIPDIKNNYLRQWLRKSGTIEELGHPLTRVRGHYYMHRVLFEQPIASDHLGARSIPKKHLPKFTETPRELRYITIRDKTVYVARQSEQFLNSLHAA